MVTLRDVAKAAGVSATTASAALRGKPYVKPETAQLIRTIAEQMHYEMNYSARALTSGKSGMLSIVVPNLSEPYYPQVTNYLMEEVHRLGMPMIIHMSDLTSSTDHRSIRQLATFADGIFAFPFNLTDSEMDYLQTRCPVVMFNDCSPDPRFDVVNVRQEHAMNCAVEHLIARGYQRIGILGHRYKSHAEASNTLTRVGVIRPQSALRSLADHGLPADDSMIRDVPWTVEDGIVAANRLVDEGMPFDAVLCMNDAMALGTIRGFASRGVHVPHDVAVMGVDGIDEGSYSVPSLSTVAIDFRGMAHAAVQLMLSRITHSDIPEHPQIIQVGYQLIVRESTTAMTPLH